MEHINEILVIFENVRRRAALSTESGDIFNVSSKINGDSRKWGHSISLRYNHVSIEKVGEFVQHFLTELEFAGELYDMLSYCSVTKCYRVEISNRKIEVPGKRNIYITVAFEKETYDKLKELTPSIVDNYQSIDLLIAGFERLKKEVKNES